MAETRTGLHNWLGLSGTQYSQELVRQASRVASELVEQPTHGVPRVVDIVRQSKDGGSSANNALGVPANWTPVAGRTGLSATMFMPNEWDGERDPTQLEVRAGERTLLVADVPEAGSIPADRIMLTDKVRFVDPVYGDSIFTIEEVNPIRGTGLVRIRSVYSRSLVS